MYKVILSTLPILHYTTPEDVWDNCPYLSSRKQCLCPEQGCRCAVFDKFKKRLELNGCVALHAALVYSGDEPPNLYAVHAKQQKETL